MGSSVEQGLSSQSLLALSNSLASISRVNDQLLAKEEAMVTLEKKLYFELHGFSFNTNESLVVPRSQNGAELLLRKQKMLQKLEKELKLSSLRFANLVEKQRQLEDTKEEKKLVNGNRLLHPELERELRQSSLQLARLVEEQRELDIQDDGGEDDMQGLHCKGLNLNQQHLQERMEQIQVVIESSLLDGGENDSHFLGQEEEISQSSLQLASLMENSLSMEEESEGSEEEECGLQQLTTSQVMEESALMTTGKDSWDGRGGSDDHECGNDASCLMMDTGWNAAKQVCINHTKSRRTTIIRLKPLISVCDSEMFEN